MRTFFLLTTGLIFLFCSCKKREIIFEEEVLFTSEMSPGLPANPKAIHGYLYSGNSIYTSYTYFYTYSTFSDPARNLIAGYNHYYDQITFSNPAYMGNVEVGAVTCNSTTLSKTTFSPNLIYSRSFMVSIPTTSHVSWQTEGNRGFKQLDITSVTELPILAIATATFGTIKKSEGTTIDLTAAAINYDSLIVIITDAGATYNHIRKAFGKDAQSAVFKPDEFKNFYNNGGVYGTIGFYAYNYSYQIIDNKTYLFELSSKCSKSVFLSP